MSFVVVLLYSLTGDLEYSSNRLHEDFAHRLSFRFSSLRLKEGPQRCVVFGAGPIPKLPEDVILVAVGAASVLFAVKVSAIATS